MQFRRGRPFDDELRQQQPPLEAAKRLRQRQRVGRDIAGCRFGKRNFVLIDIADGDDARQNRRVVVEHVEKFVARQPARPPAATARASC